MIRSTVLTSLIFSTLCHAEFAGMYVDTSDLVTLNGTLYRSHRVYAVFTGQTDRVISVSGSAPLGLPDLEFSVIGSGSLYRECVGGLSCETLDASGGCALTAFGIVAEKNKVCLFTGKILTTFSTSLMKPISSILSASSRTKYFILFNEQKP